MQVDVWMDEQNGDDGSTIAKRDECDGTTRAKKSAMRDDTVDWTEREYRRQMTRGDGKATRQTGLGTGQMQTQS